MAKQRPQARTANELRSFLESGDERLVALDASRVAWLGSSAELGHALGIKRQAMTSRLRTLRAAGVADTSAARRIVFDVDRLSELATGVRHLRLAESTQQFRSVVGETYAEQRSADGGVAYRHRETGQRASVRDLTRAAGYESPSSTQYHLKVLADTSAEIDVVTTATESPIELGDTGGATQPLAEALTELSALLASAHSDPRLQATVLDTIAAVSRSGQNLLSEVPPTDADDASSSRGSRLFDAITLVDCDYEGSKSTTGSQNLAQETRTGSSSVEPRDKNASLTRRPHVAPDQRQLAEPVPLSHQQLSSVFAPLVQATTRSHPDLSPNWLALAAAAAPWPIDNLTAAVGILTRQLDSGFVSGECTIDNPYAVFSAAAKRGDLEYFPLRSGADDETPRHSPHRASSQVVPPVSEASLRSCLIADLERADRCGALDALVARCQVAEDPATIAAIARKVILEVEGAEAVAYFNRRLASRDPAPPADTRRLTKGERQAILGASRSRLPTRPDEFGAPLRSSGGKTEETSEERLAQWVSRP